MKAMAHWHKFTLPIFAITFFVCNLISCQSVEHVLKNNTFRLKAYVLTNYKQDNLLKMNRFSNMKIIIFPNRSIWKIAIDIDK